MDDFFTLASFLTLGGCVTIVIIVVNALRSALGWGPKWFGLLLAIGVSYIAYFITISLGQPRTEDPGMFRYLIVFLNGCLIYTSAYGIQNTAISKRASRSITPPKPSGKILWRDAW